MVKVSIRNPHNLIVVAIKLIERLNKKNNLGFDLEIIYDYSLVDYDGGMLRGVYFPDEINKIYINPSNCVDIDIAEQNVGQNSYYCYTNDLTILGVAIHEFCHFLTEQIFKTMLLDYRKSFPTHRFYLNDYSDFTIDDEVAEAMTLYITNPFLLNMISNQHWKFFAKYFKSPVPSSHFRFYQTYQTYPQEIKLHLENKWKIVYNIETDKFEKIA